MSRWRKVCICEINADGSKGVEKYAVIYDDGRAITDQFSTLADLDEAIHRSEQHHQASSCVHENKCSCPGEEWCEDCGKTLWRD